MGRVSGKVALVTGGASGIGAATARALAAEGAKVVVADVAADRGRRVADEIAAAGGDAAFQALDVTDEDQWAAAVAAVVARFGGLHVLFNNAGTAPGSDPLEDVTLAEWRRVMAINIDGVFLGLKHGIRAMKGARGSIINTSSIYGLVGAAMIGGYSASKGGVTVLTKAAAVECAHLGYDIRVNSIHPGFIETPMTEHVFGQMGEDRLRQRILKLTPLHRAGAVDEVAQTVLFLASDESSFVTGAELVIDGGFRAQ